MAFSAFSFSLFSFQEFLAFAGWVSAADEPALILRVRQCGKSGNNERSACSRSLNEIDTYLIVIHVECALVPSPHLLRLLGHRTALISVRDTDIGRLARHPGQSSSSKLHHVLHPPPFVLRLLLHVPRRRVDAPVKDKQDHHRAPEVAHNQRRVEDGVLRELHRALAWGKVSVALVVLT